MPTHAQRNPLPPHERAKLVIAGVMIVIFAATIGLVVSGDGLGLRGSLEPTKASARSH